MHKCKDNIHMCFLIDWGLPSISVGKEFACNAGDQVLFLSQEYPQRRDRLTHASILGLDSKESTCSGLPGGSDSKESACNARDPGFIPGLGRSPEESMATYSSPPASRIMWTKELGRLQSMESHRVRHS